jgi:DNA-binding CsgD family transcriptional regulator/Tfp pilus assembly protein PilF
VHKSLVVAEPTHPHTARYRMLDTIREYALEKLQLVGEWRRKHADYFTEWTATAAMQLGASDQVTWLQRIDEEQANIRLALEWSFTEQPVSALRLAAAMGNFWWMSRNLSEGLESLTRALASETSNREFRASALVARARLSRRRGDWAMARSDAEEAAAIGRRLGLNRELILAVNLLGVLARQRGDTEAALAYFEETMALADEQGDGVRRAYGLNNIAMIESQLGHNDTALAHVEQALSLAEEGGDRFIKAMILDNVGRINFRLENRAVARRSYEEALTISADFQDNMNIADSLEGVALMAISDGDAARALVLVSAAEALRAITGGERWEELYNEVADSVITAKARLGQAAADKAWRRGAAMSMDEAVRFALGGPAVERHGAGSRLTDREIQVARLIAGGLTNKEIAQRLKIAGRTVDAHVEHIRNKVGLRTRAQIAVWAHERLGTA